MMDLGITDTPFGRVVLMVAVSEDVVLYAVLAVALGLSQGTSGSSPGLWTAIGSHAVAPTMLYFTFVSVVLIVASRDWGPRCYRWLPTSRANVVARRSPVASRLIFLFAMVLCCMALGVNSVFGALMAGICASRGDLMAGAAPAEAIAEQSWGAIRQLSMAFFIPVFFALVGINVDLAHGSMPGSSAGSCWPPAEQRS